MEEGHNPDCLFTKSLWLLGVGSGSGEIRQGGCAVIQRKDSGDTRQANDSGQEGLRWLRCTVSLEVMGACGIVAQGQLLPKEAALGARSS